MRVYDSLADYAAMKGEHLGKSEWIVIDQSRIDAFAEATNDHQWIHTDPERVQAELGMGTIAHGYLILSLLPALCAEICVIPSVKRVINYGANKTRFVNMVPVNSELRCSLMLKDAKEKMGGLMVMLGASIELKGSDRPALITDLISILFE